jgi:iron complex transport system ATP-binding protein
VLDEGRIVADGPTWNVLEPELIADVFGVRGRVTVNEAGRRSLLVEPLNVPAD